MMQWIGYLVLGFVALMLLMQQWQQFRARRIEGQPAPDIAELDGAGDDGRRVYYFYAAHCGPCRATTPVVDRLRQTHRNLVKVDVAEHGDLARRFGIAATPSFVAVEDGLIAQVRLGAQSEKQILALLQPPAKR